MRHFAGLDSLDLAPGRIRVGQEVCVPLSFLAERFLCIPEIILKSLEYHSVMYLPVWITFLRSTTIMLSVQAFFD